MSFYDIKYIKILLFAERGLGIKYCENATEYNSEF